MMTQEEGCVRGSMNQGWHKSHSEGLGLTPWVKSDAFWRWDQADLMGNWKALSCLPLRCMWVQVSGHSREKPAFLDTEFFTDFSLWSFKNTHKSFSGMKNSSKPTTQYGQSIPFYLSLFLLFSSNFISTLSRGVSVLFFKLLSRLSDVLSFYQ